MLARRQHYILMSWRRLPNVQTLSKRHIPYAIRDVSQRCVFTVMHYLEMFSHFSLTNTHDSSLTTGCVITPQQVQVWDTAGQERFRKSMVEHYYRNVHAVVFVYDVTKMASFQNLKTWIQECNGHRVSPTVPRVLVGNKCDLVSHIQVPSNTALKFADAHNMLLFETSAKDPKESQNVDSIFMCLACRLKAQKSLLYRDVEREDGRVRLSQETDVNKSNCPC